MRLKERDIILQGQMAHINRFVHTKTEEKNLIFYVLQSFNSVIKKLLKLLFMFT